MSKLDSRFRVSRLALPLLVIALWPTILCAASGLVERNEAMAQITALRGEVLSLMEEQRQRFDYGAASEATLSQQFDAKGVQWARRYIEPWAGWHYVDWQKAKSGFFGSHAHKLLVSATAVSGSDGVPVADLDYLAQGVRALRDVATELNALMLQMMAADADRALLLDQIQTLTEQRAVADSDQRKRLDMEIEALREEGKGIAERGATLDSRFHTLRQQELFSALTVPTATRVAVPETTAMPEAAPSETMATYPRDCETQSVYEPRADVDELVAQFDNALQQQVMYCPGDTTTGGQ